MFVTTPGIDYPTEELYPAVMDPAILLVDLAEKNSLVEQLEKFKVSPDMKDEELYLRCVLSAPSTMTENEKLLYDWLSKLLSKFQTSEWNEQVRSFEKVLEILDFPQAFALAVTAYRQSILANQSNAIIAFGACIEQLIQKNPIQYRKLDLTDFSLEASSLKLDVEKMPSAFFEELKEQRLRLINEKIVSKIKIIGIGFLSSSALIGGATYWTLKYFSILDNIFPPVEIPTPPTEIPQDQMTNTLKSLAFVVTMVFLVMLYVGPKNRRDRTSPHSDSPNSKITPTQLDEEDDWRIDSSESNLSKSTVNLKSYFDLEEIDQSQTSARANMNPIAGQRKRRWPAHCTLTPEQRELIEIADQDINIPKVPPKLEKEEKKPAQKKEEKKEEVDEMPVTPRNITKKKKIIEIWKNSTHQDYIYQNGNFKKAAIPFNYEENADQLHPKSFVECTNDGVILEDFALDEALFTFCPTIKSNLIIIKIPKDNNHQLFVIDFKKLTESEILKKIKNFSSTTQGIKISTK